MAGMAPGREGVKQANALLRTACPDTVHTIEDQIAAGDKVMTRLRGRGTFRGEILGIPPNGKVVTIQGIAIHRIADGKLVEHWGVADKLSDTVGQPPSTEIGVPNMPSLKAQKLRKFPQEKILLEL